MLQQQAAGPARGRLSLSGPPRAEVGGVEQADGAGEVLDRAGGPEQRRADVVIDVVEGVSPFAVVRPVLRRTVGQAQRAMVREPVQAVDDGAFVLGDGRLEAETI